MTWNVRPRSWPVRFFTFASRNAAGRFAAMMRATSKNSVPCVLSRKPVSRPRLRFFDTPARLNGWHGKPASTTSQSGMSAASTLVMSPAMVSANP